MAESLPSVLLVGVGEYTTGYVGGTASTSDKGSGVVGLTFFDLRHRGKVGSRIGLCGTNGSKMPGIRAHLKKRITDVYGIDVSCETYPSDDSKDGKSYISALTRYNPGDIVVVTTPDDTHFDIALAAINRGCHVMVTKPIVKTLKEHRILAEAAVKNKVLVAIEYHKRFDPIYSDAVTRMDTYGDFSYYTSYMSQPKKQLETFGAWAGKSSDISYYLNAHHIDVLTWHLAGRARCARVMAVASTGVAKGLGIDAEDTITITSEWVNNKTGNKGIAIFTASWVAPKSDVHSQQRFHYMGATGEIKVDQAHRGVSVSTDADGFSSPNPLYMRYAPRPGKSAYKFLGQQGYGYRSFEAFLDTATQYNKNKKEGKSAPAGEWGVALVHSESAITTTAILEAARRSLDNNNAWFTIVYGPSADGDVPVDIQKQLTSKL